MTLTKFRFAFLAPLLIALLTLTPLGAVSVTTPAGLLSNTTLNGAINGTQTTLVLASASASSGSSYGAPAVGQCLYVDNELMRITAVSSTTMTVRRGTTGAGPHETSAIILTGPCSAGNGGFKQADPINVGANQTCSQFVLPWVNVNTGDSWWCDLSNVAAGALGGSWSVTNTVKRNGTAGSRRVAQ